MDDSLRAGKPPQNLTEPPGPTQPPTLSGAGNEYRPKYGDALRMGVKEGWAIPYVDKLRDPSLTRANLRASGISIAVSQTLQSVYLLILMVPYSCWNMPQSNRTRVSENELGENSKVK